MQTQQQDSSLSSLLNSAIVDGQTLVKQQIELTKAELSESAKNAAATSGMFIGAAFFGFLGFVFLLVAAAYGLVRAGLDEWAAFLIVAAVLLLVTAILALMGRSRAKRIGPPERSIAQVNETKAALTSRGSTTTS
jgi:Putative Actinobacterial Holin-X, holin superfamily III